MPRIRYNILANVLGRAWAYVLAFLLVPVYLRCLGVEAYALVGFQVLLLNVAGMFDLGLAMTLNRELARCSGDRADLLRSCDLLRTLETVYLAVGLALALLIFFAAVPIADYWLQERQLPADAVVFAIRLMAASVLLQMLSSFYQAGLMGLQRQALANGVWAAAATFRGGMTVGVLFWVSRTIQAFFLCQALALALSALANRLVLTRTLAPAGRRGHFRIDLLCEVRRFSLGAFGNNLAGSVFNQLDKILLSRLLPLETLGYYMLASTVVQLLISVVQPVNRALFPRYTQLWEQGDRASQAWLHHHGCQLVAAIVLPAAIMLTVFSRSAMFAWTGDSVVADNTAMLVAVLGLGMVSSAVATSFGQWLFASGRPHVFMWINIGSLAMFVPLLVIFVHNWGALGAAAAWSLVLIITRLGVLIPYVSRVVLSQSITRWLLTDIAPAGAAALGVGLVARCLMPQPTGRWSLALFLGAVGVAMVGAAALVAGHIRRELFSLIAIRAGGTDAPVASADR